MIDYLCKNTSTDSNVWCDSHKKSKDLARSQDDQMALWKLVEELEAENGQLKSAAISKLGHKTDSSGNTPLSNQSSEFTSAVQPRIEPPPLQVAAPPSPTADQVSSLTYKPLRYYCVKASARNYLQVQRACREANSKPKYYEVAQTLDSTAASSKAGSPSYDFTEMAANNGSQAQEGQKLVFGFFSAGDPNGLAAGYDRLIAAAHMYFPPCRLRAAAKPFWPKAKA